MIIKMIGIDFNSAELEIRERLAFGEEKVKELLESIKTENAVLGCVIVATCNRTEVYFSLRENLEVTELFCDRANLAPEEYEKYIVVREQETALRHLMLLSSGLISKLRGDDQIIAQVKDSIVIAREAESLDTVLEVAFRNAVTCGKKIKTDAIILPVNTSAAIVAVDYIKSLRVSLKGEKALVIGNGQMGRLAAQLLLQEGAEVTVTLRSYKRGKAVVPEGAKTISYDDRYLFLDQCNILVSATASPHYTVTKEKMGRCERLPDILIDIAVPRDIEPSINELGAEIVNIDMLGNNDTELDQSTRNMADEIIDTYMAKFYSWANYRESIFSGKGEKR